MQSSERFEGSHAVDVDRQRNLQELLLGGAEQAELLHRLAPGALCQPRQAGVAAGSPRSRLARISLARVITGSGSPARRATSMP